MFGMGTWEIALVLVIALLVLGPDKLPGVARSIGKGLREMRRAANDLRVHMELDDLPDEPRVQTAPNHQADSHLPKADAAQDAAQDKAASPASDEQQPPPDDKQDNNDG